MSLPIKTGFEIAEDHRRMRDAGPELYEALDQLLHALHPATQRVAAAKARAVLAKARGEPA